MRAHASDPKLLNDACLALAGLAWGGGAEARRAVLAARAPPSAAAGGAAVGGSGEFGALAALELTVRRHGAPEHAKLREMAAAIAAQLRKEAPGVAV